MGWLLFIFLLYYLCLVFERSLVGLSAQDLDGFREEKTLAARHLLVLGDEIRPSLAAMLLARILLVSMAGVCLVAHIHRAEWLKNWLAQRAVSSQIDPTWIWGGMIIVLVLGLSLAFWGLQKLDFQKNRPSLAPVLGKRLWWLGFFWKTLFHLFLKKEKNAHPPETEKNTAAANNPAASSEKRELELLKSIVQFGDVTVKQVMQPRSKVVSVDFRTNFHELLEVVRESEFSRLPVHNEDLDNVMGILYVKDLLPHLDEPETFEWQPIIRTNVMMVPESKRGSELLEEFKQQRMHMAIVVDEYGGIAGIVTMEDILEEVTGDIRDEFDEDSEIRYRKIDDFNYLFEGQTLLNDVCRLCALAPGTFDSVRGASDTLAGLALELRGDIPLPGTEVAWNGFLLTITKADKRRIEQLRLTLPKSGIV